MEVTGRSSREDGIRLNPNGTNVAINCDPCENEGDEQAAEGFCVDCQEYLCSSCFKIHRRPKLWRHHVLKDKESMPKSKTTREQLNYECTEPCSEHPSKILEYFCQTHAKLGCPICVTENHRTCNDVDYIPNIADRFKESTEAKEVFKTLHILKEQVEKYSSRISNDKIKLKTYENDAKAQILQLRDEFNSICDRLVENVEGVSQFDQSKLEGSLSTCEEILKKIRRSESVLQKKQAEMKMSQFFTEAKLSKQFAEGYAKELEMVKEHTKTRHYEVQFDVEALREKFKLTFLDPSIEQDGDDDYDVKEKDSKEDNDWRDTCTKEEVDCKTNERNKVSQDENKEKEKEMPLKTSTKYGQKEVNRADFKTECNWRDTEKQVDCKTNERNKVSQDESKKEVKKMPLKTSTKYGQKEVNRADFQTECNWIDTEKQVDCKTNERNKVTKDEYKEKEKKMPLKTSEKYGQKEVNRADFQTECNWRDTEEQEKEMTLKTSANYGQKEVNSAYFQRERNWSGTEKQEEEKQKPKSKDFETMMKCRFCYFSYFAGQKFCQNCGLNVK